MGPFVQMAFIGLMSLPLIIQGHNCQGSGEEGEPVIPKDLSSPGVFDDLSVEEIRQVEQYITAEFPVKLTKDASPDDPFIFLIERQYNKKSDVLKHLDEGAPIPRREARVVLYRPDLGVPAIQELIVYPLPEPSSHEPLHNSKWRHPIPYTARPLLNLPQETEINRRLKEEMAKIDYIIHATTGGYTMNNCTSKCLTWFPGTPGHFKSGESKLIIFLERAIEGAPIYPIGFQAIFNMGSARSSEWDFEKVWYQGRAFDSIADLKNAFDTGDFSPPGSRDPENVDNINLVGSMNFRGDPLPKKKQRPPMAFSPDGRRFKVDGHHVMWQGWSYNVGHRTSSGPIMHDIRFLDNRIAYEFSVQELSVHYSGGSPLPMNNFYFDSLTLTGTNVNKLFPGTDCPEDAVFLDVIHYIKGRPQLFENAICIFEHDRGIPLRRHWESDQHGGYKWYQGMRDIVLITRSILTVYNYDYIFDVMLHQAGQIEGKVTLSGYTINSYYTGPEMDRYGHQTQPDSTANIHQHLVNFKVDLDIGGIQNRFHSLDLKREQVEDTFLGTTNKNRYFEPDLKETEQAAAYEYNFETPKYLVQFNENLRNKYGYVRGYRIVPASMSKLLLEDDDTRIGSIAWAKYQVAVTKFHDDEPRSSSMYMSQDMFDPIFSFQDFLDDNERIVDEDLVTWITVGAHHIPHSGDLPVVLTPGVQLTFYLLPYNYFDDDPSLASRDNIRVDLKDGMDCYKFSGLKPDTCVKTSTSEAVYQHSFAIILSIVCAILSFLVI